MEVVLRKRPRAFEAMESVKMRLWERVRQRKRSSGVFEIHILGSVMRARLMKTVLEGSLSAVLATVDERRASLSRKCLLHVAALIYHLEHNSGDNYLPFPKYECIRAMLEVALSHMMSVPRAVASIMHIAEEIIVEYECRERFLIHPAPTLQNDRLFKINRRRKIGVASSKKIADIPNMRSKACPSVVEKCVKISEEEMRFEDDLWHREGPVAKERTFNYMGIVRGPILDPTLVETETLLAYYKNIQ